jgi:hypothetical protein
VNDLDSITDGVKQHAAEFDDGNVGSNGGRVEHNGKRAVEQDSDDHLKPTRLEYTFV